MKNCSKCNIPKEESEYASYYHSNHNKTYTRNICKSCFNEQKRKYRETIKEKNIVQPVQPELQPDPIIDYSSNPDYKRCNICKEYLLKKDYFYTSKKNRTGSTCKPCIRLRDKIYDQKKNEEKGGADMIYAQPNKYYDEMQREMTFKIMLALGWSFNESNGIWYKEGIKSPEGDFLIKTEYLSKKKTNKHTFKNRKELIEMAINLRKKGVSYDEIATKLNISHTTAHRWINQTDILK